MVAEEIFDIPVELKKKMDYRVFLRKRLLEAKKKGLIVDRRPKKDM